MICVNELEHRGIFYTGGLAGKTCRMFSRDEEALHKMAKKIEVSKEWFRDDLSVPYYILDENKRLLAIRNGVIFLSDTHIDSPWFRFK